MVSVFDDPMTMTKENVAVKVVIVTVNNSSVITAATGSCKQLHHAGIEDSSYPLAFGIDEFDFIV